MGLLSGMDDVWVWALDSWSDVFILVATLTGILALTAWFLRPKVFNDPATRDLLESWQQHSSENFKDSSLARQSLYVKFDPLVRGQSPTKRIPSLRQGPIDAISEGGNSDLLLMGTPPPNKDKQRRPAARSLHTQVKEQDTETCAAPSDDDHKEVDKLLARTFIQEHEDDSRPESKTPTGEAGTMANSADSQDNAQFPKFTQSDLNKMRQEMEFEFQARLLARDRDWQAKCEGLENKAHLLNEAHEEEYAKLRRSVDGMTTTVAQYELTISQLIATKEEQESANKQALIDAMKEKDQALEDLQSVETAFADLHRRFEKAKASLEALKKNEAILRQCVEEKKVIISKQEAKYNALKKHAEEKLEIANTEIDKIQKSREGEITKLQLLLKKSEWNEARLQQTVEQKEKENSELTAICDELISKVN